MVVQNIPTDLSVSDLIELFVAFGTVLYANIRKPKKQEDSINAFVMFDWAGMA